jgi:hypothetical protein
VQHSWRGIGVRVLPRRSSAALISDMMADRISRETGYQISEVEKMFEEVEKRRGGYGPRLSEVVSRRLEAVVDLLQVK